MAYHDIQQICKADDYLFVLASNDLYQYNLNDQSITTYDKINGLSDSYLTHIAWNPQAKRLIAIYQNSNIDLIDTKGNITNISALYAKTMTEDKTIDSLTIEGPFAYLYARFGIVKVNMQRAEIADTYRENHPEYPTQLPAYDNSDYEKYLSLVQTLLPGGPNNNYFYESKFANNLLYTTGGFFLSGLADLLRPGTVQVWDGNDWQVYEDHLEATTGYDYIDINCIDYDPTDISHVAVGGRCGLYEFQNGKLLKYHNQQNSPLKGAMDGSNELGNKYTLVHGVKFDKQGNLWVLNSQANATSLLELKKNGEWESHHSSLLTDNTNMSLQGLRCMIIDSRGLLWFCNSHWNNPALFCYNFDNNNLQRFDKFTNQDGTNYVIGGGVSCVCEDLQGNIWVGTSQGPFMIERSEVEQVAGSGTGTASVVFQQIKVPRNDGSNFADYLLSGVSISSIVIDGGNRKWFSTNGAGAFLISADNMEQLQYFTAENSKLLANNVMSCSINQQTGEVFFLTEKGLCSYMSDAAQSNPEMTKDNVYAYPNPVTPDYTGLITVTGLSLNADVKILSSSGKLIAEGRSNGGLFTWDGNDKNGHRVASGVYMVVTATSDGKKGTVCKIAVIN
jgi:streptogramin lyase